MEEKMTSNNQQQDNFEQKAADVLTHSGIANLTDQSTAGQVASAMNRLGQFCAGLEPVLKEAIAVSAIFTLHNACGYQMEEARKLARVAMKGGTGKSDDEAYGTYGEAPSGEVIIDLAEFGGRLHWVVARPGTGKVSVVEAVDGREMWPRSALPWDGIPHVNDVRRAWGNGVDGRELFLDLAYVFNSPLPKQRVILAEPEGVWAAVLALWVMGSYLLDRFRYFPILLLEGPPARGKTRLGKAAIFLAFRGIATMSPTPATIFRNRSRHLASYFVDIKDVPGKMAESSDFENLILGSFERDQKVQRVLRLDAPTPVQEMKSFTVYGATVVATNVAIRPDDPLASRCLRISLPEAGSRPVEDAVRPDDELVMGLRARLVAWAAQLVADGIELPTLPRVLTGRLHDIASPLLQVARLVYPGCVPAVIKLLQGTEKAQRQETADSWEGRVVKVLIDLRSSGQWASTVGIGTVAEKVNEHVSEKDQLTPKRVGTVAKHLSLKSERRGGYVYLNYPGDDVMHDLGTRYGFEIKS
jgi:hypothetical protein